MFDQKDCDMLRTHYLQPKVRRKEEIPSRMHLRRRYVSAAIDGKMEGYKQLKQQIQKLEIDNDVNGIYRLLKALRRFTRKKKEKHSSLLLFSISEILLTAQKGASGTSRGGTRYPSK